MIKMPKITMQLCQDAVLILTTAGLLYLVFLAYQSDQRDKTRDIVCYKGYKYTVDTIGIMRPMFKSKSFLQYEVITCTDIKGENDGR